MLNLSGSKIIFFTLISLFCNSRLLGNQGRTLVLDTRPIYEDSMSIDLTPYMSMFVDTSGHQTFSDLNSMESSFVPADAKTLDGFSEHSSKFWLHFKMCAQDQNSKWYLGFLYPEVKYFKSVNGGQWVVGTHGYNIQDPTNAVRLGPDLFFTIELNKDDCHEYYFRCSPRIFADLSQGRIKAFHRSISTRSYIDAVQRGRIFKTLPLTSILFTIFFYHLILFIYNGQKAFLYLALFSLGQSLVSADAGGLIIDLLRVKDLALYMKIAPSCIYLLVGMASPFTIQYLTLSPRSKAWTCASLIGILWTSMAVFMLIIANLNHEQYLKISPIFLTLFTAGTLVFLPGFLIIGFTQLEKNKSQATYYVLAFGVWTVASFIAFLFIAEIIPGESTLALGHTGYKLGELGNIGATAGMLLFSFGLARQFKTLQEERAEADKQKALSDQFRMLDQKEADRLRELDRFKSQLYTNITHEFRTPLTVISGMADQLPRDSQAKELINRNADQLLDLVNQMLDLSKIDAGKLVPVISQMDIIPILKYYSEEYIRFATSKDKHFQLELMDDVVWMDIDPDLLGRICHNLVHNAIKFSPQNGQVKMRVEKVEDSRKLQLTISDQGRGIPVADIDRIFDRFYQVDTSNTRHGEGTGIGLAIVKEITQLLNGTILVDSKEHIGSTFTLTLPIEHSGDIIGWSPGSKRNHDNFTTLQEENGQPSTAFKILIVEDHSDVRAYLTQLIDNTYHIDQADNGRTGLSLAFDLIPDLIISDVMMPEIDGFKFCETIKKDPRTSHIPVILLTAKSTQEDKLDGLQGGADAYLVKPFDKRELFLRIEKLLEHREKVRQYYQQFQMLPQHEIKENKFLQKVRKEIESNLCNEQYQIEDLAHGVNLGRVQLYRKLKALTGKSYTQLLREMRISRAKDLLKKTDKTISEIAFEVGFNDRSYFGKVFKKEVGMNASEYRSQTP